jgi:uncharacterized protein
MSTKYWLWVGGGCVLAFGLGAALAQLKQPGAATGKASAAQAAKPAASAAAVQTAPAGAGAVSGAPAAHGAAAGVHGSAAAAGGAALTSPVPELGSIDGLAKPGSGSGVHGAGSPFAPLKDRPDVVSWSMLTAIKTKVVDNKLLPIFGPQQLALNKKTQRVQGFMMPLEPGDKQRHFILSSVPLTCSFCLPGGPESLVEVKSKTPIAYSLDAVVVEGQFAVLPEDPYGVYYRVTEAVAVK